MSQQIDDSSEKSLLGGPSSGRFPHPGTAAGAFFSKLVGDISKRGEGISKLEFRKVCKDRSVMYVVMHDEEEEEG
jgi:hypothetical protein